MGIVTLDELARGACIGVFGGMAGACTLVYPGSPVWLLPAGMAVVGCAATYPEVRAEVRAELERISPALTATTRRALTALPSLPALGRRRDASHPTDRPDEQPRPTPPPAAPQGEILTLLADAPHRLVIGHTRGGKTTLLHALATRWAADGARVMVADPDAAPGQWPGCEVAGAGDDMPAIAALFDQVRAEVASRRRARAEGARSFPPLHLVIDEAQDVLPGAGGLDVFEDVARRGAKLGVRLTVGVQDRQVATLGLEGKSAILRNLTTVDVMRAGEGRIAVLRDPETGERHRYPIPPLPDPEGYIRRSTPPADPDPLAVARAAVPAISPERAERLARILARAGAEPGVAPAAHGGLAMQTGLTASQRHQTTSGIGLHHRAQTNTTPAAEPGLTASQRHQTGLGVTVDTEPGGHVTVNVTQVAGGAGTGGRRRAPRGRAPAMRGRRERLARRATIRALLAEGLSANEICRRIGGDRTRLLAEIRQIRGGGGGRISSD